MKRRVPIILLSLLSLPLPAYPAEEPSMVEEPLWELGVGAGALHVPDYPASSEGRLRGVALPYVVYRGDVLRIGDGQTLSAVAAETERFELTLDFDAAFDADSERNMRRSGMPDLDYLFEVGPEFSYLAGRFEFNDRSRSTLELALRARSVFSTDLKSIGHRGYVLEPKLEYRHYGLLSPDLEARITVAPVWADRAMHGYFYDVESPFARPDRPQYHADGGYFGTGVNFYGTWHATEKLRVLFGVQTTSYHGAANRSSPLFEAGFTWSFGAGFIWSLLQSEATVERPRGD